MSPEVSQHQRAEEEGRGAVAGAARRLHLGAAYGFHVKLQDHDGEDDHPQRDDEGGPGVDFALQEKKSDGKTQNQTIIY